MTRDCSLQQGSNANSDEHDLDYAEADYIYSSGGRRMLPDGERAMIQQLMREKAVAAASKRPQRSDLASANLVASSG